MRIEIENGIIVIHYDSDDGSTRISYQLLPLDPTTITDDIDPQSGITSDSYDLAKRLGDKR